MSAGQRTYLLSRNNGLNEELRKAGETFDEDSSSELFNGDEERREYDSDDYVTYQQATEKVHKQPQTHIRRKVKTKIKRPKLKARMTQVSIIEPKLTTTHP